MKLSIYGLNKYQLKLFLSVYKSAGISYSEKHGILTITDSRLDADTIFSVKKDVERIPGVFIEVTE